ncbi:MFS transporter [Providencia vermicola]|uniref:MFS transporter n=1 Tax=Providencia vermicola TaxID=333965 RepID=UPI001CEC2005|nr:MFS transporter [Providencia vermicola]
MNIKNKNDESPVIILVAACLTAAVIPLSIAAPAVIIPEISRELKSTSIELIWIINAYILTYGSCTLLAGNLADKYGRKLVWFMGLFFFSLFSVLISFSTNVLILDILRLLQGISAAAAFSGAISHLAQKYDGNARIRAFSLIGTTFGSGAAFGPFIAGLLSDYLGWRAVFWLPTSLSLLSLLLVLKYAKESKNINNKKNDWWGAITFTISVGLITYGITLAPIDGWLSCTTVLVLLTGGALLIIFIFIELQQNDPMLNLALFKSPKFIGVQCLALAPAFSYIVLLIILPAKFIGMEGMSANNAGQYLFILSIPLLIIPILSAKLTYWITPAIISATGFFITSIGLFFLAYEINNTESYQRLIYLLIIGIGVGLPWGLMDGLSVSVVDKNQAGMATGIFNAIRLSGDGIALATVSVLLSEYLYSHIHKVENNLSSSQIKILTNQLSTSNFSNLNSYFPYISKDKIMLVYDYAFHATILTLGLITLLISLIVFILLRAKN